MKATRSWILWLCFMLFHVVISVTAKSDGEINPDLKYMLQGTKFSDSEIYTIEKWIENIYDNVEECLENSPSDLEEVEGKFSNVEGHTRMNEIITDILKDFYSKNPSNVIKNQCKKPTKLKDELEFLYSTLKSCSEDNEDGYYLNVMKTLLSTLCDNDAKYLTSFILEEDGIECFQTNKEAIYKCFEFNEDDTDQDNAYLTKEEICLGVDQVKSCIVNEMEKCENSKSGTIVESVYNTVRRSFCSEFSSGVNYTPGSNIIAVTVTPTTSTSTSTTSTTSKAISITAKTDGETGLKKNMLQSADFSESRLYEIKDRFFLTYFQLCLELKDLCLKNNPSALDNVKGDLKFALVNFENKIEDIYMDFKSNNISVAVKNQCMKSTELKDSFEFFFNTSKVCMDKNMKVQVEILRNAIKALISTLCDDDAKNLTSFLLEEDGIKCYRTKKNAILKCLYSIDIYHYGINKIDDYCKYMDQVNSCFVNEMVKCENSKSGNIVKSVYDNVRRSTMCSQINSDKNHTSGCNIIAGTATPTTSTSTSTTSTTSKSISITAQTDDELEPYFKNMLQSANFSKSEIDEIEESFSETYLVVEDLCLRNNPSALDNVKRDLKSALKNLEKKAVDIYMDFKSNNISVAVKNQCMKSTELKDSFEFFFNTSKVCMDKNMKVQVEIFQNAIKTLISTLCDDDAKNLTTFLLEEDGVKCYRTKKNAILKCLYSIDNTHRIDEIDDLCKGMDRINSCFVNEMVKCENSKSGNIVKSVYDNVRRSTMCSQINFDKNHTSGSNIIAATATPTTSTSTSTTSTISKTISITADTDGETGLYKNMMQSANFSKSEINGIREYFLITYLVVEDMCLRNNPSALDNVKRDLKSAIKKLEKKAVDIYTDFKTNNISVAVKNQCKKSTELKDSFEVFFNSSKVCMDEITKRQVKFLQNAIKALIPTLCDDDAKNLTSFLLEEDGIKCYRSKENAIFKCLNSRDNAAKKDTTSDYCKYMDQANSCYVNEMLKCENSKSGNIVKSMYDNFRRSTMCSHYF